MKIYAELEKAPELSARYGAMLNKHYPENQIFRYHYLLCDSAKKSILPVLASNPQLTKQQQVYLDSLLLHLKK